MSTIEYHYLNMETKRLVPNDETLCKEVGNAGLTRAIPYFVEDDFHTLVTGGKGFSEEDAITLFAELTGTKIDKVRPPGT